jgi:hypothetical protein
MKSGRGTRVRKGAAKGERPPLVGPGRVSTDADWTVTLLEIAQLLLLRELASRSGELRSVPAHLRRLELSELELVDVCRCDDLGGPEHHFTLGADRIFAKTTRGEFISFLAGDLAFS